MSDAPPDDIFTTIHKAVWHILNGATAFTDIVKLVNRVDMTADDFQEFKENVSADSRPEVVIVQSAFTQQPFSVSDARAIRSMSLQVQLTAGELGPIKANKVKEAMFDAWVAAGATLGIRPLNGNTILSWSISGNDQLTLDDAFLKDVERTGKMVTQSLGNITVNFAKATKRVAA